MGRTVSLILILGTLASVTADAGVPFNGKSDEALLKAISSGCGPERTVDRSALNFKMTDPFTGRELTVTSGNLPDTYEWATLVPSVWWDNSGEVFGQAVASDLYNLIPLDAATLKIRGDLAPGEVTEATFSNAHWSAGRGEVYGVLTDLYSPPASMRGELARAFFYMVSLYHVATWTPRAYMMLTSEFYPGLSAYAIPLLMAWHRSYPPSAFELERNVDGERLQGNRNPFVDYPELAEYLWGDRKGESFVVAGEPQPLRSVYKLDSDVIDLYSPWIPADAEWQIDGLPASSASIGSSQLGVGTHNLNYYSPSTGERGVLMVKVEK